MNKNYLIFSSIVLIPCITRAMSITAEELPHVEALIASLRHQPRPVHSPSVGGDLIIKINTSSDVSDVRAKSTQTKIDNSPATTPPLPNKDPQEAPGWLSRIQSFIANNKFKCAIGTLGATYLVLYFFMDRGYKLVRNCNGWCSWKDHVELAHLTCQNCDELSNELIQTIQENCLNMKNPSDYMSPFSQFLREISDEQAELERYITLGSRIVSWRLSAIFPVSKKLLGQATMRFERLKFVRKLFVQWNAKHNITQRNGASY